MGDDESQHSKRTVAPKEYGRKEDENSIPEMIGQSARRTVEKIWGSVRTKFPKGMSTREQTKNSMSGRPRRAR